ncbi:hypothetical protein RRG08_040761 [Elysia crispata]|uniref:Transposase n=1 Tax=Elysia crispata TaxID=231223 RepID=A0AAE1EE45_9GAST|nr:hypothetical protein RRG08_040761 [Elysia crispata]
MYSDSEQPVYDEPYCHEIPHDYHGPQDGIYGYSGFWDIPTRGCLPEYDDVISSGSFSLPSLPAPALELPLLQNAGDLFVSVDQQQVKGMEFKLPFILKTLLLPLFKRQSAEWRDFDEPRPEKVRRKQGALKVMHMIFFDMNGVILRWPVPIGTTINAQYYKKVLQDKLRPAIRKKRPGLLESGIMFYHDNAPVHTARAVTGWLQVGTVGASSLFT